MHHHRLAFAGSLAIAIACALAPVAHAQTTSATAPAARIGTQGLKSGQHYDRFIITYRQGSTERRDRTAALQNVGVAIARSGLDRTTRSARGTRPGLRATYRHKLAIGADLIQTSRGLDATEATALMREIARDPAVQFVEPDLVMHAVRDYRAGEAQRAPILADTSRQTAAQPDAFPQDPPGDPGYALYQWDFFSATGGADVPAAWQLADGSGVTVAVLDTGLTHHGDIDDSLAAEGYDFLSDKAYSGRASDGRAVGGWDPGDWTVAGECGPGWPARPSSWHGTHVAGTIAALTDNGVALAGMAGQAKVLPVRVLGHCGGPTSDIADAIVWAAGGHVDGVPDNAHPARVINMSLSGAGYCESGSAFATAIKQANVLGAAVVVAAGNEGGDVAKYTPANCPGAITVGATGIDGGKAEYSNYGSAVAIAAPGGGICPDDRLPDPVTGTCSGATPQEDGFVWSLVNSGQTTPVDDAGNGEAYFAGMAGTSQATPHVTATVALMLDARRELGLPEATPEQVREFLIGSVRKFPLPPSSGMPIGAGIVDAAAAIQKAVGNAGGEQALALENRVPRGNQYGTEGESLLFKLDVPAGARNLSLRTYGGTGDVSLYVGFGGAPDVEHYAYRSVRIGNNEAVLIQVPREGTYYLRVVGKSRFNGVSVLGNYTP